MNKEETDFNRAVAAAADPSTLTTQAILREVSSLKELFESRLAGIEKAIEVAHEDLVRFPTEVQEQVANLRELHDQKFKTVEQIFETQNVHFNNIQIQFSERDVRTQQTAKALSEATEKSERQFTKQIDQISELNRTESKGLVGQINELKDRFSRGEGRGEGTDKSRADYRLLYGALIAGVGLVVSILVLIFAISDRFKP